MSFTHLHVHSEYSLLDGLCKLEGMAHHARDLGMDALAITDHGALYGAVEFYEACQHAGIKALLGVETYVAPGDHRSKTTADRDPWHLGLIAKNEKGWRNLLRLVSKSQIDGFYYKPRVDHELLAEHAEGLIALSGCLGAEVPKAIQAGDIEGAKKTARWYKETFGNYYLELQNHPIPELDIVNRALIEMSKELDIPLVATNDAHYVEQHNHYAHDVLLCIQTNSTVQDEKRMKFVDDGFYLKSPQEMSALFADYPEAITNTQKVADMCDVKLDFSHLYFPEYQTPGGMTADQYLEELCWKGLKQRYGDITEPLERRLKYELDVIQKTEFANYFLVVWDIISFAQKSGILYGVRGSAAASIVLYCLGITDIDPVGARLVFERFLNIERKEMPDIDMDFADDRREEMVTYVAQKYGYDHVAHVITFGTLGAKASVRDVARALGLSYGDGDRVARLIPAQLHMTLKQALEENQELAELYQSDQNVKQLIDTSIALEGTARHASTHAAGVVISKEPLIDLVPLQRPSKGTENSLNMTQWPMADVAHIGLVKMDFLGLINLTILGNAIKLIKETTGQDLDLKALPLDDAKTYELLAKAETTGVFQLESAGMRRYIKELQPHTVAELAAMVALYRPGPMQHIPQYIEARHGRQQVHFPHPALADILEDTYGVIVYQDQVLLILQHFAGYSLGQADIVRKAMGKKIAELMQAERTSFVQGAQKKGFTLQEATEVFDLIEPFAGYAFNKAHATSYAMIAYQTAYLKANYPAEYMCAFMTSFHGLSDKLASAVAECGRLGVKVLSPDINRSDIDFRVEEITEGGERRLAVRFGLAAVKNVGEAALEGALTARAEGGPFSTIQDFLGRADLKGLNKRTLESLIKAGALDGLGKRGALLLAIDQLLSAAQRQQRLKESGQSTMFDLWGESVAVPVPEVELPEGDIPSRQLREWETEMLGVCISQPHPFASVATRAAREMDVMCSQIDEEMVGMSVTVAGAVSGIRPLLTREGKSFITASLEDLGGSVEVTVWPELYQRTRELWSDGQILKVQGKVTDRRGEVQLTCNEVEPYEPGAMGVQPAYDDEEGFDVEPAMPVSMSRAANVPGTPPHNVAPSVEQAPTAVQEPAASFNGNSHANGNGQSNGNGHSNGNGNGSGYRNGNGYPNGNSNDEGRPSPNTLPKSRSLTIQLYETQDSAKDMDTFNEVLGVLGRYPGSDPVKLTVFSGGTAVPLELPGYRITLGKEVLSELGGVVGEGSLLAEGV